MLIFFLAGCASEDINVGYGSTYKALEHGDEIQHTPQQLREECKALKSEIRALKEKKSWLKGPDSTSQRRQVETDIKYLQRMFKRGKCEEVLASTPEPVMTEHKHDTAAQASHEHTHDTSGQPPSEHPAAASTSTQGKGSGLTFDECFTKCKELTSRTNEQCFDACMSR